MIGSLMYLTASRPDIMYAVCVCARYQSDPKESHLVAVKRIFRYLKGKPNLGLWYPYEGNFELYSYSDSDFGGCALDRKSTTGGCQFLGPRLVSWQCKKQTNVSVSTAEAEYIAASAGCSQVLWLQYQLLDYGSEGYAGVNPQDLVDEVPDNLLDDDEYFARHPEDEEEEDNDEDNDDDNEDSDSEDDGGNDGAESESNSEEAEIVETVEPMEVEIENVVIEEPVEVASAAEEVVAEIPKDVTVQYVRRKRSKSVKEPMIVEPEEIDVLQIAQEAMAEAETMAQIVEEADAGIADPIIVDLPTTSSQFAENIVQGLESSPNFVSKIDERENEKEKRIAELEEMVAKLIEANDLLKASNERKKKRFDEYWDIHNQNLKTFKKLDEDHVKLVDEHVKLKDDYEKLKEEHENLKYDYKELKAECNTLEAEKEMLEKWLEETKPKKASSSSDKDFSEEVVEVTESQVQKVYLTRARGTSNIGIRVESPINIPDEAVAETVNMDKAEGKRKIDAIPEIFGDENSSKKAKIDETVQIEPIQSVAEVETEKTESIAETEIFADTDSEKEVGSEETVQVEPIQSEAVDMPKTVAEVASQFKPVQTDNAPMIEALDDLDDIDFTESEDEAEPEPNVVEEIPDDLDQRFAYLERMKYNSVFLNGLTVSQINEEYEKCMIAQDKADADKKEFVIEMGEWTPMQESLNIEDLPPTELYHQNPEDMTASDMRSLNLDSLRRMNACPILTNESKPRQAKIAEKFKSCIEEALKEQEEYKGKELLNVKDEPEDW
ncbi:hypothetical protein QVD17_38182 [Tagetes erecta]|uniref:Uncharacterized protein n=1 Tax=Tagetes erecta TaxID=13708 RepID=A0AAD8JZM3_TARER|nr:hypothetical protein QVD17_38182 [Tagetes erecta]